MLTSALARQAAVALVGPRQVGKTTLALEIASERGAVYLDLEDVRDREKPRDPQAVLSAYEDRLVILDEIHRTPELFQALRGLIDRGRRRGKGVGGSCSWARPLSTCSARPERPWRDGSATSTCRL